MAQAKPRTVSDSAQRAEAQANFEKAMEAMAKLRATIDSRPGRLIQERKTAGR